MNNQLLIVESAKSITSNPTGVSILDQCGKLRFVGQGIEFEVYHSEGNTYVKANIIPTIPIVPQPTIPRINIESIIVEIDSTSVRGSVNVPLDYLIVSSKGKSDYPVPVRDGKFKIHGKFDIDNINDRKITISSTTDASLMTEVFYYGDVPGTPDLPLYMSEESIYPSVDSMRWDGISDWYIKGNTNGNTKDGKFDYVIRCKNGLSYDFDLYTMQHTTYHFEFGDNGGRIQLYNGVSYSIYYQVEINNVQYRSHNSNLSDYIK